jgi:superfamily I DNA/RNA helicase
MAYSDKEEASIVCNDIVRLRRQENASYSDFAILYRTNSQSRTFEEQMRKQNIPYRIYGGLSFYQRKEIKDIIAYFRLVVNPNDEEAFKRIVNYPARGIGDTTVGKIAAKATQHAVSLWEVICHPDTYALDVSKGTLTKLRGFQELMAGFIDEAAENVWWFNGEFIKFQSANTGKILNVLTEHPGITVRELVDEVGINKSAIQKQLQNLQKHEYIIRTKGRRGSWHVAIVCTTNKGGTK